MKSNFIIIVSEKLRHGKCLKQISIFLLCCIVAFTSPLCVRAASTTTSRSSGEYVTVEVPLAWTVNKMLSYTDGTEYTDESASVTGFINVIPEAQYTVIQSKAGVLNGTNAFYYNVGKGFINFQELWNTVSTTQSVALSIPAGCEFFRLSSDLTSNGDSTQQVVYLGITVSATYMEENNLTEETLIDVVYKDDNNAINDAADKFTDEYEILHEQEDYLLQESKSAFDNFFASFSWSDLAEYSAGFQFIGTWFSNFYNSHSAVAVSVGMASGLVILMILMRFRGH